METEPIEAEVCTATSCPSYLPFTPLPKAWAGKKVRITLSDDEAVEIRLWDTQWMNIVNHDNCWRGWNPEEAVQAAVKMVEAKMARNYADGHWPPAKTEPTAPPQDLFESTSARVANAME